MSHEIAASAETTSLRRHTAKFSGNIQIFASTFHVQPIGKHGLFLARLREGWRRPSDIVRDIRRSAIALVEALERLRRLATVETLAILEIFDGDLADSPGARRRD